MSDYDNYADNLAFPPQPEKITVDKEVYEATVRNSLKAFDLEQQVKTLRHQIKQYEAQSCQNCPYSDEYCASGDCPKD